MVPRPRMPPQRALMLPTLGPLARTNRLIEASQLSPHRHLEKQEPQRKVLSHLADRQQPKPTTEIKDHFWNGPVTNPILNAELLRNLDQIYSTVPGNDAPIFPCLVQLSRNRKPHQRTRLALTANSTASSTIRMLRKTYIGIPQPWNSAPRPANSRWEHPSDRHIDLGDSSSTPLPRHPLLTTTRLHTNAVATLSRSQLGTGI